MPEFLTIDDLSLNGKTVLLRADLNVPMQNGKVTDDERLQRILPTLKDLAQGGAKIAILAHFGRPKNGPDPSQSLKPVAAELERLWGQKIIFAEDCVGPKAEAAIRALAPGQVAVLENTRFHAGEEANDQGFAEKIAALGDIYVNDAFSAAHRAHATTEGLAHFMPAAAGRLMEVELNALASALSNPERPVAAIVGGSKISTKLDLLNNLVTKVDLLILGGGMANTFLAAQGVNVGKSLHEADMLETAKQISAKAKSSDCRILLPKDGVVAEALKPGVATSIVKTDAVPADRMILDVGPESVKEIRESLAQCKTVVWNGPLGAFETQPFDRATNDIARTVAELTKRGTVLSVAGGGDTVAALANAGVADSLSYMSTAGGAFLEWLEGKELPGVAALRDAKPKNGKVAV